MAKKTEREEHSRSTGSEGRASSRGDSPSDAQQPPAPEIRPRVQMHRTELVGIVVIVLVPLLALLGVFGPEVERARGWTDAIALEVRYPARYRLGMTETLEARVSNRSGTLMPRVALAVDGAYLDGFATASPTPDFARAYAVELIDLAPGETRTVVVDLQAEHAGRFRGRATATATHARDSVTVPLTTLVLP
ncbi:MAG: hypothetical protein ACYC2G_05305 [Gemmatimonadaceae bacterium]